MDFAFDFDPIFTNQIGKGEEAIFKVIVNFYEVVSSRPDIKDHPVFRAFLNDP